MASITTGAQTNNVSESRPSGWENFWQAVTHPFSMMSGAVKTLYEDDDFSQKYDTRNWSSQDWIDYGRRGTNDVIIANTADGVGHSGSTSIDSVNPSNDATGYDQAAWALEQQWKMDEAERNFNSAEAAKTRDWQKMMSDTSYQRAVADLTKAGLNPWLALNGGSIDGASTPSGAQASSSSGSSKVPTNYTMKLISGLLSSAAGIIKALL